MTKIASKQVKTSREDGRKTGKITECITPWGGTSKYAVREYRTTTLEGEVTLYIDVDALLTYLGHKALSSKGLKAVEASGAVLVTAKITSASPGEWKEHTV